MDSRSTCKGHLLLKQQVHTEDEIAVYEKGWSKVKNSKRIVICAAFLLVAVGGLMIAAAAIKGNFDIENMKGLSYEMKTFEVTEAFSDIHVEDAECNVRILRATDGKCKVVCPEKQDGSIYHTVTVSDGELSVQRHDKRKWYQYIGISFGAPDVEVYLPEKEYGKLVFHSTAGSIQVDDGFVFENASLDSTSGRVTIENASPETLTVKTSSGRIVLSHIRSGEITAKSAAGKIELTDVIAEKSLYARSISDGVALDGCDGGTIKIETTSGSVKGTILSDKIFITDSTSGSVKVPRSAVGRECEITTTSGSIDIEIKQ